MKFQTVRKLSCLLAVALVLAFWSWFGWLLLATDR